MKDCGGSIWGYRWACVNDLIVAGAVPKYPSVRCDRSPASTPVGDQSRLAGNPRGQTTGKPVEIVAGEVSNDSPLVFAEGHLPCDQQLQIPTLHPHQAEVDLMLRFMHIKVPGFEVIHYLETLKC